MHFCHYFGITLPFIIPWQVHLYNNTGQWFWSGLEYLIYTYLRGYEDPFYVKQNSFPYFHVLKTYNWYFLYHENWKKTFLKYYIVPVIVCDCFITGRDDKHKQLQTILTVFKLFLHKTSITDITHNWSDYWWVLNDKHWKLFDKNIKV